VVHIGGAVGVTCVTSPTSYLLELTMQGLGRSCLLAIVLQMNVSNGLPAVLRQNREKTLDYVQEIV
jgi:hypothetical protein